MRLLVLALLLTACDLRADRESAAQPPVARHAASGDGCEFDSVRPATGAPAEGLWTYEDRTTAQRVAAMVGPAKATPGTTQLTRRVETLESLPEADTIRHALDAVSVRLELIPPLSRPAAVYAVGPLVLLASYEPCDDRLREPLIRYLRQDTAGRVATDVLLRRDTQP